MNLWNSLQSFITIEENQRKVNSFLCFFLFSLILINLTWNAFIYLQIDILFFFTSDAIELMLTSTIAYLFYYKIVRHESLQFKFFSLLGMILLLAGLAFLKTYRRAEAMSEKVFSEIIFPERILSKRFFSERVFSEFTSFLGLVFIFIALFYIFDNLNLLVNNSFVKTKKSLKEAEYQLLRRHFNPHFLYNAFNSLYSMSLQSHPQTSASILELSSMMRYLTDNTNTSKTPIKQEFNFIENYTNIERIRFGEDANITFEQKGNNSDILIEPLLLITLVENAFKHGFYTNKSEAFVNITSIIENSTLIFTVRNSVFKKQHFQESNRVGTGLTNLRKRLNLSYPNKATLNITERKNEYIAILKINL